MCAFWGWGGESHAGGEHKGKWGEWRKLGKGHEQSPQAHGQQLPNSSTSPFFLEIMNGALGSKSWLFGLVPISDWKLLSLNSSAAAKLKCETLATGRFLRSSQNAQSCFWLRQLGMSPMTVMEMGLWSDGGRLKPVCTSCTTWDRLPCVFKPPPSSPWVGIVMPLLQGYAEMRINPKMMKENNPKLLKPSSWYVTYMMTNNNKKSMLIIFQGPQQVPIV